MTAAFFTLGCKLNQSESEALATGFRSRGFSLVSPSIRAEADVFIINSCTVTSKAEQKARRMIRGFARNNPDAAVLVTGCYAQLNPEAIEELAENVLVLSLDAKAAVLDLPRYLESAAARGFRPYEAVAHWLEELRPDSRENSDRFRFRAASGATRSRAFLKVQDGCDNECAYCRVRLARGKSVSLPLSEVLSRAAELEARGFGEIVLTGVNLTAWKEKSSSGGLLDAADLIAALHERLAHSRIRLSSMEPDMINRRLAEAVSLERIRPHFHLPVQSGSDSVLASVGRHYNGDGVRRAVELLLEAKDDPFLAADVIVGLPGESDRDFEDTMQLVRECGFAHIHAFPFSPRPGTPLYDAKGKVPERIAGERLHVLSALSSEAHRTFVQRQDGKRAEAVVERIREDGSFSVLTDRYLHLPCQGREGLNLDLGRLCLVDQELSGDALQARFVKYV